MQSHDPQTKPSSGQEQAALHVAQKALREALAEQPDPSGKTLSIVWGDGANIDGWKWE